MAGIGISVIIPTLCEAKRAATLRRAVESVRSQGFPCEVILAVNGNRFDEDLFKDLRSDPGLKVLYLEEGNPATARAAGLESATMPFFAFIDDDDVFLPGGFAPLLSAMEADPMLDLVVGNGIKKFGDDQEPIILDVAEVNADPVVALLRRNWLGASSGIFRTSSFDKTSFFKNLPRHNEWTILAFNIALEKRILALDVNLTSCDDTPGSLSKSYKQYEEEERTFDIFSKSRLPPEARRLLQIKRFNNYHSLCEAYMERKDMAKAWRYHWKSLGGLGGLKFLPFTRRLIGRSYARMGNATRDQGGKGP